MRIRIVAVAALLLFTLTGCAGTPESAASEAEQVGETAAPLVAEAATDEPAVGSDSEAAFLAYVHENLPTPNQIPDATDEQLLAAAEAGCDRLAAGESSDVISLVEGETANGLGYFEASGIIISGAREYICP